MKSKTYTGEYSLRHWINLILKKNIILPEYQRSFVWNASDIERLLQSLLNGQFIQPVTIARMHSIDNGVNLILDGQQRLTSLLLLALSLYPQKEKFKDEFNIASDDDSASDSYQDNPDITIMDWTFQYLLDSDLSKNTFDQISLRAFATGNYDLMNLKTSHFASEDEFEKFLDETFLGFSYIVPDLADSEEEQKFFSTLFRNMNYLGRKLSPLESRKSLYYLKRSYKNYFEGTLEDDSDALDGLRIIENVVPRHIDFVRYLSILSQYSVSRTSSRVLVGYSAYTSRENYYVDYVSYILGLKQESREEKFNGFDFHQTFGQNGVQSRFSRLRDTISCLKDKMNLDGRYPNSFRGWIDADYWLFGLIYWIVIKDMTIDLEEDWSAVLLRKISSKKRDDNYTRTPNLLKNLRDRMEKSIAFFRQHLTQL